MKKTKIINGININFFLIIIFTITRILDIFTTITGLSMGLFEYNPISRYLISKNFSLFLLLNALSIIIFFIINIFLIKIKDEWLKSFSVKGLFFVLIFLNLIGLFVVFNNIYEVLLV